MQKKALLGWLLSSFLLPAMLVVAASPASRTATVSTDMELQAALVDPSVQVITVTQDLQFQRQNWVNFYSRSIPYVVRRNLTVTSQPLYRKVDFTFLGDGQLQLAPGTWLNITHTVFEHARYGAGVQLDILGHSPGSYLVLWDSVMLRLACVSSAGEPDAVAVQPRLPGFPGEQVAKYEDSYCFRRKCHDHVLVYQDFTKLTGASTEDTLAGGYAIIMRNFTKVCLQFFEDNCLGPTTRSVDECVRDMLDSASVIPTPGQMAAAAQAAAKQHVVALAVGLSVGLGGGLGLAMCALLLLRHRRRRKEQQSGQQKMLLTFGSGTPGAGSTPDPELGAVAVVGHDGSGSKLGHTRVYAISTTPPNTHNSWELTACKTSDHFLHSNMHNSHHFSSADMVQLWSSASGNSGWCVRGAGGVSGTSHVSTSPTTADLIAGAGNANEDKVTLGILLGAGSFGRVYKGRWRGIDVAVKVLQHSRAAAPSVANEVDLMMSFQHPHVVSAYHFVSWKKRRSGMEQKVADVIGDLHSGDISWHADTDTNTALADFVGPTGEFPEDTQTWLVQEFCDGGNLSEYCVSAAERRGWAGQLPEGHAMLRLLFRLREVADGMSYLHSKTVVHGDLKSGNVLLTVSATSPYGRIAKVTDFGLSRAAPVAGQTHRSTHTLGTVSHMAPELLRFGKMSPAVDVFSFGIMMWELLTSRIAFQGLHYGAIIEHVALMGERPEVPAAAPEDYSLLMCSCWNAEPQQRPSFEQVVRCLDIMITCRQQELAEAKSSSSLTDVATAAAAACNNGNSREGHAKQLSYGGSSNGEFEMTISTRGGLPSGKAHVQQHSQAQQPQQQQQQQQSGAAAQSAEHAASGRLANSGSDAWAASPYGPQDL